MEGSEHPVNEQGSPAVSRPERNAKEVDHICRSVKKGTGTLITGLDDDSLSRLRTLCHSIPGTESLREYVRELFESLCQTGELAKLPESLDVNIANGAFGLFNREHAREFERMQILDAQPAKIKKALVSGERKRAGKLRIRISQWKERFEKLYGEKVECKVNLDALLDHQAGKSHEKEGAYGV